MFAECRETVSILYALVFGAGDACIDLSVHSILWAFGAFMVLVVIAQLVARKLWKKLIQRPPPVEKASDDDLRDTPFIDDPNYRNSAIRSSKR